MSESIKVIVRVRPPLDSEVLEEDSKEVVDVLAPDTITVGDTKCSYDKVFDADATQEDVYSHIKPSVEAIATGVNCTVFAYGQTGSGKTHSMLGTKLEEALLEEDNFAPSDTWGIIPRAVDDLFLLLAEHSAEGTNAAVHCAYMQIYNDKIYDLLQDRKRRKPLQIREIQKTKKRREVYVQNLAEYRVSSAEDVLMLLQQGGRNRAVRGTEFNVASSRSHALLQISVEVETAQEGGSTVLRRAKLTLVDLAGSEKWNTNLKLGAKRAKELTHINQSLSALGNCIAALTEKKRSHVPYRDSKLTRLLQDSLGGNTRTTIIATVAPMQQHQEESISTLHFADRAAQVMTRVRRNEVVDDAVLLARAQKEISRLRTILTSNELAARVSELDNEVRLLKAENKKLRAQVRHHSFRTTSSSTVASAIQESRQPMSPIQPPRTTLPHVKGAAEGDESDGSDVVNSSTSSMPAALGVGVGVGEGKKRSLRRLGSDPAAPASARSSAGSSRTSSRAASASRRPAASKPPLPRKRSKSLVEVEGEDDEDDLYGDDFEAEGAESGYSMYDTGEGSGGDTDGDGAGQGEDFVIDQLRAALKTGGANTHAVMRMAADAEEQCGRELEGLMHSVDSIAAERRLLEQQLAQLQDGALMKQTVDYLAEGRRQRSRSNSATRRRRGTGLNIDPTAAEEDAPSVPNTPGLIGPARGFTFGKADVGAVVSVFSVRYDEWSSGNVMAYDAIRKMHLVVYRNGDRKWHAMRNKKFKVQTAAPRRKKPPSFGRTANRTAGSGKKKMRRKKRGARLDRTVKTGPRSPSPVRHGSIARPVM